MGTVCHDYTAVVIGQRIVDLRQGRNHFPSKSVLTNQLAPFSFLNMFSGSTLGNHTFPAAAAKACNELQSTISLHNHCWHAANNSKLFSLMPYMTDLLMSVCELNWLNTPDVSPAADFFHLWYLCQIRQHISRQVMKQLLHAFVISRLDYCNGTLASLPMRLLGQLQRVQNAADRRVLGLQPRDHIKPALAASALEDTIQTVCVNALCVTVQCPSYISNIVRNTTASSRRQGLRSSTDRLLYTTRTKLGERAFCHWPDSLELTYRPSNPIWFYIVCYVLC